MDYDPTALPTELLWLPWLDYLYKMDDYVKSIRFWPFLAEYLLQRQIC